MVVTDQTVEPISSGILGSDSIAGLPLNVSKITDIASQLSDPADSTLFENALRNVEPQAALGSVNEQAILSAHEQIYKGSIGAVTGVDTNSIGSAAALETLKSMVSGAQGISLISCFLRNSSEWKER